MSDLTTPETTVSDLPDPTNLSSDQRLALIQKFRTQVIAGKRLTPDEAHYAISLLRMERAQASAAGAGKTRTKEPAPTVTLEDFFN